MKLKKDFPGIPMPFFKYKIPLVVENFFSRNKFGIALMILWILVFLFLHLQGKAQAPDTKLKLGAAIPNITILNIRNYKSTNAQIQDFKGKLLILDFWATWCQPCIRIKPRIDSLQKLFNGKVQFISVTDQPENIVLPFLKRLKVQYPVNLVEVVHDRVLTSMFKPVSLPQFVWINADGKLLGFSDDSPVNAASIQSVLDGMPLINGREKLKEVAYDIHEPLFREKDISGEAPYLYHSLITGYKEGFPCISYCDITATVSANQTRRITAVNQTVAQLYQLAMGDGYRRFGWERTVLDVKDTNFLNTELSGSRFDEWLKNNRGFCYELIVPKNRANSALAIMRQELALLFPQYSAAVEKRIRKCLALVVTKDTVKATTVGATPSADLDFTQAVLINCNLDVLTRRIAIYLQKYNLPVVNLTGYKPQLDLEIHADLADINAVNKELSSYNLKFEERELNTEVLVIRDK